MKTPSNYTTFATMFRIFLKKRKYDSPSDFHKDLLNHMGKKAPGLSTVWAAFYGARVLPLETILFMVGRYDFDLDWRDVLPMETRDGYVPKNSQMALPGMRDLR